jgi:ABC-type dipeptide/oligopeptide/nickel transport system permease subunit
MDRAGANAPAHSLCSHDEAGGAAGSAARQAIVLGRLSTPLIALGDDGRLIAVAIINVPTLGRLTRVAVLQQRREEYVEAARVLGATTRRVVGRHILPNVLPVLLVQTALMMGEAVLLEAAAAPSLA